MSFDAERYRDRLTEAVAHRLERREARDAGVHEQRVQRAELRLCPGGERVEDRQVRDVAVHRHRASAELGQLGRLVLAPSPCWRPSVSLVG